MGRAGKRLGTLAIGSVSFRMTLLPRPLPRINPGFVKALRDHLRPGQPGDPTAPTAAEFAAAAHVPNRGRKPWNVAHTPC